MLSLPFNCVYLLSSSTKTHKPNFSYCCSITVASISPPLLPSALPISTSHIQSSSPSLSLSLCPLYMFLDDPSPSFHHYSPPPTHLVTVSLSFISILFFWHFSMSKMSLIFPIDLFFVHISYIFSFSLYGHFQNLILASQHQNLFQYLGLPHHWSLM